MKIRTRWNSGVRARIRRVAGCATQTGSAGHAGATANVKLTFHWTTQRGLIKLRETEIDALVRLGLLRAEMRNDANAIIEAVYAHFDRTLDLMP